MNLSLRELFTRLILSLPPNDTTRSTYYTALMFLVDDSELFENLPPYKYKCLIDVDIVEAVLGVSSPIEIALVLWSPLGCALSNETFQKWFQVVNAATTDFRAIHYLAGAAYDRLRGDIHAVDVPPQLVEALFASPSPDARIIAAKLVAKLSSDATELVAVVRSLIHSESECARAAGTYILEDSLNSILAGHRMFDNPSTFLELRQEVQQLLVTDDSQSVRDNAEHALRFLGDLEALGRKRG
jgi:hypothetical protein